MQAQFALLTGNHSHFSSYVSRQLSPFLLWLWDCWILGLVADRLCSQRHGAGASCQTERQRAKETHSCESTEDQRACRGGAGGAGQKMGFSSKEPGGRSCSVGL